MRMQDRFNVARLYDGDLGPSDNFLLVSRWDINEPSCSLDPKQEGTFRTRIGARDANTMLNTVVNWMTRTDAMDQRALHGDKRHKYSFSFYRLAGGDITSYPSRFASFQLKEFLFPDRHVSHAGSHDDYMRMIDRDRLGLAMRTTLARDLGLPLNEKVPALWRPALRLCGHPDRFQMAQETQAPVPAPIAAFA